MTVSSSYQIVRIVGNGATTTWPFPWVIFDPGDLLVALFDAAGNAVPTYLNALGSYDYAVTGAQDPETLEYPGVSVVFRSAIPSGYTGYIAPNLAVVQELLLSDYGPLSLPALMAQLDRVTLLVSQVALFAGLAVTFPLQEAAAAPLLPGLPGRIGQLLGFDGGGAFTTYAPGEASAIGDASLVTWTAPWAGAVAVQLSVLLKALVTPQGWGVAGAGADEGVQLQKWLSFVVANGRGSVVPAGNYATSVTLQTGTGYGFVIRGESMGAVTFTQLTAGLPIFGVNAANGHGFRFAEFTGTWAAQSGPSDFGAAIVELQGGGSIEEFDWQMERVTGFNGMRMVSCLQGALSGAVNSSQTTIAVASARGFPTAGNFLIQIDSETMQVTGGQGTTTWTVTRGYNGSTAAAHSNGAGIPAALNWGFRMIDCIRGSNMVGAKIWTPSAAGAPRITVESADIGIGNTQYESLYVLNNCDTLALKQIEMDGAGSFSFTSFPPIEIGGSNVVAELLRFEQVNLGSGQSLINFNAGGPNNYTGEFSDIITYVNITTADVSQVIIASGAVSITLDGVKAALASNFGGGDFLPYKVGGVIEYVRDIEWIGIGGTNRGHFDAETAFGLVTMPNRDFDVLLDAGTHSLSGTSINFAGNAWVYDTVALRSGSVALTSDAIVALPPPYKGRIARVDVLHGVLNGHALSITDSYSSAGMTIAAGSFTSEAVATFEGINASSWMPIAKVLN